MSHQLEILYMKGGGSMRVDIAFTALVVVVVLCMSSSCVCAVSEAKADVIAKWLQEKHAREAPYRVSPGISAVIIAQDQDDGQDEEDGVQFVSLGVQDARRATEVVTPDSLFEIGSLSKTFVAIALSRLIDTGHIASMDDPVHTYLGDDFKLGNDAYVSRTLTIRDLLSHRTGIAQGQGDFIGSLLPSSHLVSGRLAHLQPAQEMRTLFQYSNTGWVLAGEVLRVASNAETWCDALHQLVLEPLKLTSTFCHRNEIPDAIADAHLSSVHKMDPCGRASQQQQHHHHHRDWDRAVQIATYEFVKTGGDRGFAWGAADAAGSVISSARDMATIMKLLLHPKRFADFLHPDTVQELLSPQMLLPKRFLETSGVFSSHTAYIGEAFADGLGFDIVGRVLTDAKGRSLRYAEKNGDTEMHKARLGLFVDRGEAVLLLSNLGGEVGGQLTALKFGVLKLLADADPDEASQFANEVLENTRFWDEQWKPMMTCNACGKSAYSGPCIPGGQGLLPLRREAYTGSYGNHLYSSGDAGVEFIVEVADENESLLVHLGPLHTVVTFGEQSMVQHEKCAFLAQFMAQNGILPLWSDAYRMLNTLTASSSKRNSEGKGSGEGPVCVLAEFAAVDAEIPEAGVSARNRTIAFPWGSNVPLPDGPSVYAVSHLHEVLFFLFDGVAFFAQSASPTPMLPPPS